MFIFLKKDKKEPFFREKRSSIFLKIRLQFKFKVSIANLDLKYRLPI